MSVRDTKRYLLGGATEIELDKQGRFVIPDYLMSHAKIETEIVFLGVGEWVELWSKAQWDAKSELLSRNASDIAERLAQIK
jgi:MraZ protein